MELSLIRSYLDSKGVEGKMNGFLSEAKYMFIISENTTAHLHDGG